MRRTLTLVLCTVLCLVGALFGTVLNTARAQPQGQLEERITAFEAVLADRAARLERDARTRGADEDSLRVGHANQDKSR